ncbi:YbfB/YjiJ family MFS transporter [Microbacterium sp. MAHUQ-60]|uniref:YbfB/YjiJ family MFS transporter n=1 Tax=unclassified Microbacterium TaxID=2609290 RepID=UPI00361C5688
MASGRNWGMTAALGASVIAVCYGFARYAYGLFVPEFTAVFALNATGLGILGGVSTLGYTSGLLAAPRLARRSARGATVAAGACAVAGLIIMSTAGPVVLFAFGLLIAGSGAGLVSPAVAQLIGRTVRSEARSQAQTWANTGTSFGLIASAFTPVLILGWREIWWGFAVVAVTVTVLALLALPRPVETGAALHVRARGWRPGTSALLVNSLLLGITSAPYWNFSVERVTELGFSTQLSSWFWLVIGVAGPAGGLAGGLCRRYGITGVNVATWTVWAFGLALLALPVGGVLIPLISAAVFGAAFMALTGICILWAALLFPEAPAHGVTLSFLGLGAGQTLGAPLAGAVADSTALAVVFACAAALSLTTWWQLLPRVRIPDRGARANC